MKCPYCEQAVTPKTDGRCPACHRVIGKVITPQVADVLSDLISSTEASFDDLVDTIGIVAKAVQRKQKDKAVEALSIFLMQFLSVFEHSQDTVARVFPVLESLKQGIEDGAFAKVLPSIRSLDAYLRKVQAEMRRAR